MIGQSGFLIGQSGFLIGQSGILIGQSGIPIGQSGIPIGHLDKTTNNVFFFVVSCRCFSLVIRKWTHGTLCKGLRAGSNHS